MGIRVWSKIEFFSNKINKKNLGRFNPPSPLPSKTKVNKAKQWTEKELGRSTNIKQANKYEFIKLKKNIEN